MLSDMEPQRITEGNTTFTRYYCTEGYIDRWVGDCNHNPNNPEKPLLQLNVTAEYVRCNGGEWLMTGRRVLKDLMEYSSLFTADELVTLWEEGW